MQGTGRGSEHRRHSVLPPTPTHPRRSENKQGQSWGWGGGCLSLRICCIWKHKCLKMMNSSTNVCFSYSVYAGLTGITNTNDGKFDSGREAKFIVFPNPQVRTEDTDQIRRWLSENLTAPMSFFTAAHNCYSRKKGCFSRANLWHFIPFS